jgi:hypothetical protein
MRTEDLVGAWRELGRDFVSGDGSIKPDIPRTSQIMYTPDGFMGVVNTPAKRARVGEGANPMSLDGIAATERAAAAEGVVAYTGRYEVRGDVVHHTIYSALNPNLAGSTQERHAILNGDDLTLATLPDVKGNYFRIRWRRAAKMP